MSSEQRSSAQGVLRSRFFRWPTANGRSATILALVLAFPGGWLGYRELFRASSAATPSGGVVVVPNESELTGDEPSHGDRAAQAVHSTAEALAAAPNAAGGVAVLPIRAERQYRPYATAARDTLENVVADIAPVVERERLDGIIEEQQFAESMLVDEQTTARFGNLTGARKLVMGSIVDVSRRTGKFTGYGVKTAVTEIAATVRVRVVDVGRGTQLFSRQLTAAERLLASQFGDVRSPDVELKVIKSAFNQLSDDQQFRATLAGGRR